MRSARLAVFLLLPWIATFADPSPAWGATVTGKVVAISDGDTLTVLTAAKEQVKVRLAEIDTPESRQPYGTRARQALSELGSVSAAATGGSVSPI